MACQQYDYYSIFSEYGAALNEMILTTWVPSSPFPVYADKNSYSENITDCFKGILIWEAQRYYDNPEMAAVESKNETACDDVVGFFIVPNFGPVNVIPNMEYRQRVTILFDSNTNPDADPFGVKISKYIDWFINANYALVNDQYTHTGYFELSNSRRLYIGLESISEPIYTKDSVYVRRVVSLILRHCNCGG